MGSDDLLQDLAAVDGLSVRTDQDSLQAHRWDRALDPAAGTPLVVVRPTTTAQVAEVVTAAARHGVPIVPRGAGSGLSGGVSALDRCLVLCLADMTEVQVDAETMTATVQPGVINADLKAAAAAQGLWYPPDPASFTFSSIGGNVATNAGGLCCVKYGVTADYVLGLEVVLADGSVVRLGAGLIKDVAGLSLLKLFVGSEGTLGVITRIVLRLLPPPAPVTTLVATFADLGAACTAVGRVTALLRPAMLELMDNAAINAVEDVHGYGLDRDAGAMLIAQSDQPGAAAQAEIDVIAKACQDTGAAQVLVTADLEEGERYAAARRAAIPAVETKGRLLLGDVGAPIPRLADLATGIAEIARQHDVVIALIAHAGDGNTHPLVVCDPDDPAQTARAEAAYGQVMDLAISLNGTITGEHGVGRTKKAWLADQVGDAVVDLNRRVKAALDPDGLFNPGAIL